MLSPAKTEGPYFVDEKLNRADIRVDPTDGSVQAGIPLQLTIRAFDSDRGCAPVQGATIDVWHANAQGSYSDVAQNGTAGKKYLRGFQKTDASGAVKFTTIYPGWYQGRTIHIHFKVRLFDGSSETYEFTSQIFFDEQVNNTVMSQAAYNRGRTRDTLNANDNVYGSDGAQLIASTTGAPAAGYAAVFDVGLSGLPASRRDVRREGLRVADEGRVRRAPRAGSAGSRRRSSSARRCPPTSGCCAAARRSRDAGAKLKAGTRRPTLLLAKKVAAGSAQLQVTLKDAAGNTKVARRTVQVPKSP